MWKTSAEALFFVDNFPIYYSAPRGLSHYCLLSKGCIGVRIFVARETPVRCGYIDTLRFRTHPVSGPLGLGVAWTAFKSVILLPIECVTREQDPPFPPGAPRLHKLNPFGAMVLSSNSPPGVQGQTQSVAFRVRSQAIP